MPYATDVHTILGKAFEKLSGPENYCSWMKAFQEVARVTGILALYLDHSTVIQEPELPEFVARVLGFNESKNYFPLSDSKEINQFTNKPDDSIIAKASQTQADHSAELAYYANLLQTWQVNEERVFLARALLNAAVETWVWKELSVDEQGHPTKAMDAIMKRNKAPDTMLIDQAIRKFDSLKLGDPSGVRKLIFEFEQLYNDIKDAKGLFTRTQLIQKINNELPHHYDTFVQHWKMTHYNVSITEDMFKEYRTFITNYATKQKPRWDAAKRKTRNFVFVTTAKECKHCKSANPSKDFDKLWGPRNFDSWHREFKSMPDAYGYLGLYFGTEEVVRKPVLPDFMKSKSPIASEAQQDWKYYIDIYNIQMQRWKRNDQKVRSACAFLHAFVESSIWDELPFGHGTQPQKAWDAIVKANKPPAQVRLIYSLNRLYVINLDDPTALCEFLGQLEHLYDDLNDSHWTFTRARLIEKINGSLPREYDGFVDCWSVTVLDASVDEKFFKNYHSQLLESARDNKDRWAAKGRSQCTCDNKARNQSFGR
ncbi:hypothetical protein OPT61_g4023 [Boeremia exigua]|uniref:Uncharacterized protein n=1 Tax=Boeremia exigua TaxID=749465 RepID=A0ACC2IFM0_9PLEO|nr:hypothetical protein OPT61_g4023 [Boeremia exigua]